MSGRKKLYFYSHETNETVVDIYEAKEWKDFLIVTVGSEDRHPTELEMSQAAEVIDKMNLKYEKVVLLPKSVDFEFYGVEVDE